MIRKIVTMMKNRYILDFLTESSANQDSVNESKRVGFAVMPSHTKLATEAASGLSEAGSSLSEADSGFLEVGLGLSEAGSDFQKPL